MRRRAGQLREQGADVRALADQLVAQTESLGWTGRAAESMRQRIQERATHLRGAAAQHETAADSLDRHLHAVARLQDSIAETERKVAALVTSPHPDRRRATTRCRPTSRPPRERPTADWLTIAAPRALRPST